MRERIWYENIRRENVARYLFKLVVKDLTDGRNHFNQAGKTLPCVTPRACSENGTADDPYDQELGTVGRSFQQKRGRNCAANKRRSISFYSNYNFSK